MSGTTPPPAPVPVVPKRPNRWGAPIVSMFSLALLGAALGFAYLEKNENLLVILTGVIATNATMVVGYYVGSSASSQDKDATISAQLPQQPPPTA
jgi:hypothetical protein